MLNQNNIRHAAMLRPEVSKCSNVIKKGRHALVKTKENYLQCVECGIIRPIKELNNVYNPRFSK